MKNITRNLLSVIIFLMFIIMATGSTDTETTTLAPKDPNAWKSENNSTMAYIMIEHFVEDRLKAPKTAKFPGVFDGKHDHITYIGNHKYRIVSYVDAQNSFGALIRTSFVGVIEQTSERDWRLISLEISS